MVSAVMEACTGECAHAHTYMLEDGTWEETGVFEGLTSHL